MFLFSLQNLLKSSNNPPNFLNRITVLDAHKKGWDFHLGSIKQPKKHKGINLRPRRYILSVNTLFGLTVRIKVLIVFVQRIFV